MIKVLSIGNSFSQDAQRYLHRVAKSAGVDMKAVNLYIGGCPLSSHYNNMKSGEASYDFEFNGEKTGISVSIKQALMSDEWDIVTLQQQSGRSVDYSTYQPYLSEAAAYVRQMCPNTKLLMHRTWGYEDGSSLLESIHYKSMRQMFDDAKIAYEEAAKDIDADGIIPAGDAMMCAYEKGIKVHRDTFHASLGFGRYLIALVWFSYITGKNVDEVTFSDFDEPLSDEMIKAAKEIANDVVKSVQGIK